MPLDRGAHERGGLFRVSDVDGASVGAATGPGDLGDERVERGAATAGGHDEGALVGQPEGRRASDAASCAGDDGNLTVKLAHGWLGLGRALSPGPGPGRAPSP